MLRCLALYACLTGAATVHAATRAELPADAVRVDETRLAEAVESAGRGSLLMEFERALPVEAVARLCDAEDALASEAVMAHWLGRIDTGGPLDADTIAGLAVLADCPTRVYRRHDETTGDWWVPAFANAARARGLLQLHARRLEVRAATAALARDGLAVWHPGWDLDFARAALAALPAGRRANLAASKSRPPLATLALALDGAPQLALAALVEAPADALVGVLGPLFAATPPGQRLAALDTALARPGLGSAALLASAAWPPDPALEARWLQWLEDPEHGASVAQVLAQRWDTPRLALALRAAQRPLAQAHLALALRLQDSAQARAALRSAASSGALPAHLVAELLR